MTTVQHTQTITGSTDNMGAVHLLLTQGEVDLSAENPERVMEEIWSRATQVGSVLEGILHEPHGEPRWGLNE